MTTPNPDRRIGEELFPVYEFRPLPGLEWLQHGEIHRYADGAWLPDDGEYDLAFAVRGYGAGFWYGFNLPHHRNIMWSWTTGHWSGFEANHPRGNAWHYMLREGATDWGKPWESNKHPNHIANESANRWAIVGQSCCNGNYVDRKVHDQHIVAGLVRDRATKEILRPPEKLVCMYCDAARAATSPHHLTGATP